MPLLDSDCDSGEETDFLVTVTQDDFASLRDVSIFTERMQHAIEDALRNGLSRLALDLGELSQIRSLGLNGLIAVKSSARCDGLRVVLLNVQQSVREVFSVTRLERMFEFEDNSVAPTSL